MYNETTVPSKHNVHISSDQLTIQIVILSASIIILVLISVLIFIICCKQYSNPRNSYYGRGSSFASFQDFIRSRLENRPPTYHESQTNIAASPIEEPPPYDSILENNYSTPTLFVISTKTTQCSNNNDLPSRMEWTDEFAQPPRYESIDKTEQLQMTEIQQFI